MHPVPSSMPVLPRRLEAHLHFHCAHTGLRSGNTTIYHTFLILEPLVYWNRTHIWLGEKKQVARLHLLPRAIHFLLPPPQLALYPPAVHSRRVAQVAIITPSTSSRTKGPCIPPALPQSALGSSRTCSFPASLLPLRKQASFQLTTEA